MEQLSFFFVEQFLKLAKENDVKVYLIWPKVYETYRKRYYELEMEKSWWPKIENLAKRYSAVPVDLNTQTSCDLFYDASHQSIMCFLESMKLMIDDYYGFKKITFVSSLIRLWNCHIRYKILDNIKIGPKIL